MPRFTVAFVLAAISYVSAQAGMYQQCGGIGWSGATTCVNGATCTAANEYYSQCLPGSASTSTTVTSRSTTITSSSSTTLSQGTTSSTTSAQPTSSATGVFTIFAGAVDYGSAIYSIATYQFDAGAKTIKLISTTPTGANPSWLAFPATGKSVLYASNENYQGKVQSFKVSSSGALTAVSSVSSGGDGPVHLLPLSTGQIAVINYNAGNAAIITPSGDGSTLSAPGPLLKLTTGTSHPHQVYEYNGELFVPDLGADKIWRLKVSGTSVSLTGSITHPSGSGPRHMQISGGNLFVLHELSSTLTVQPLPASPSGSSTITSTVNVVPPSAPSGNVWAAAEILMPPTSTAFPTQYIYASNRNKGYNMDSRGDAITIIQYSGGQLSIVGYAYTGLDQVRGMQFGGPDNKYLIAGSARGTTGVAMFERTDGGKTLTLVAKNTSSPIRTSFVWL